MNIYWMKGAVSGNLQTLFQTWKGWSFSSVSPAPETTWISV